jgi:microsomal dipeptidase-like Zn-dependent dipeptidase
MRKAVGFFTVLLFFPSLIFMEEKRISFDAQAALGIIKELASDSMLGRKSGQPGGVRAEEYVASKLKERGIEPGGEDGTYFQRFTFEHSNLDPGPALEIVSGRSKRNCYYRDEWRVSDFSGSGEFTADITFVGYGIHAPERGYDDFSDIDLKGKMALMILDMPGQLAERTGEESEIGNRVKSIQELGAKGVFMYSTPLRGRRTVRGNLDKSVYQHNFVILSVEPDVAAFMFKNSATELNYLLQEMDASQKPMSAGTGAKAFLSVHTVFDERREARNVLGKITGSDRALKNEYIFISAHIDHEGIDPWGEVMPGADDNASGTAVALELARILRLNEAGLKRTVVFFLWAGEEQGYQGARHYMKNPLYPLEKTVAYINMDMVGQGSGKIRFSGIDFRPDIWNFWKKTLPASILETVAPLPTFQLRTPAYDPVVPTGIARFGLETEGYHLKYHQSRDDVDLIKPELLKKTGDLVEAMVTRLANDPRNWIPPLRRENYYLKVLKVIGFQPVLLSETGEYEKTSRESRLDLQLITVDEGDATGDKRRVEVTKKLLKEIGTIKRSKSVALYSSAGQVDEEIRQRRTTLIPGLKGFDLFRDDPEWVEVLAHQGILFLRADNPSFLFEDNQLSEEGRRLVTALNRSRLLLLISGMTDSQSKGLLENLESPVILFRKDLPEADILKQIKERDGLLGLILDGSTSSSYYKKLNEARTLLGGDHVSIIVEENIWDEAAKKSVLEVLSNMLKANEEWQDLVNLWSLNFLKYLDRTR